MRRSAPRSPADRSVARHDRVLPIDHHDRPVPAILGILVVIHELGHFVTARLANVRVLEFGIGFPPRAKVLRAKGETLYTLNWLPIGGFVKLAGEDGNDADDPRSFAAQRWITKMVILAAGVAMNVLLAFVIFAGIAWLASPLMGIRFHEVVPGSPAEAAGLQPGEAIVAVDGERYQFIAGLTVLDGLRSRPGETVVLTVDSADGTRRDVTVTLRDQAAIDAGQGALGISQEEQPWEAYFDGATTSNPLPDAIAIGAEQTVGALGTHPGRPRDARELRRGRSDGAATGGRSGRDRDADR